MSELPHTEHGDSRLRRAADWALVIAAVIALGIVAYLAVVGVEAITR